MHVMYISYISDVELMLYIISYYYSMPAPPSM